MRIIGDEENWKQHISEACQSGWPTSVTLVDIAARIPEDASAENCIAITETVDADNILGIVIQSGVRNLVQLQHADFEKEIRLSARMICEPKSVIDEPLQAYFGLPSGSPIEEHGIQCWRMKFRSTTQKREVIDGLIKKVEHLPSMGMLRNSIELICDELFTNAMFWGPRLVNRKARFAKLKRTDFEYDEGIYSEMFMATDGKQLVVGCLDPFGSLDSKILWGRLQECEEKGVGSAIQMDAISAGIGMYLAFSRAANMLFAVNQGQNTLIMCGFPLGLSFKMTESYPKNFHYNIF